MSERVIIDVGRLGEQFFSQLAGRQDGSHPFDIGAATPTTDEDVRTAGEKLFAELCRNPQIRRTIERITDADPRSRQPIYINATTVRAQAVWWEAMWTRPVGFLSLDRRWPIARIAGADMKRAPESFSYPLRIFAVISAEDRPGHAELEALRAAVADVNRTEIRIELRILTGEEALYQALAVLDRPAWLTVEPAPSSFTALDTAIARFKPHILHFFCHGEVDAGGSWLEVMTNVDPLRIPIDQLTGSPALEKVWLVVLNACLGGASLGDAPSMAWKLVSTGGVPYAIGATDPVDVRDAQVFSREFYARLLFSFDEALKRAAPDSVLDLEWGDALHAARAAIDGLHRNEADRRREWALPILYEHRSRMQLATPVPRDGVAIRRDDAAVAARSDAEATRLKMAKELLVALPPDTPDGIKASLVAAVLGRNGV